MTTKCLIYAPDQATLMPNGMPLGECWLQGESSMNSDDPALKYIPKGPKSSSAGGAYSSADVDHGTFTKIAYGVAWAVSIIGTIAGCLIVAETVGAPNGPNARAAILGLGTVAFSWIAACGIGTLAEISRKLTHTHPAK